MNQGWISLHRKIKKHWLWKDRPFTKGQAWIDILLECNHEGQKINIGNEILICNRGESIKSLKTWAKSWGWTISKVRRFLKLLENDSMIELKTAHNTTHLKVCNYESYQNNRNESESIMKQKRNESENFLTPNNNYKNNANNENKSSGGEIEEINESLQIDEETREDIRKIWISTWGRYPKIPEFEEFYEKIYLKFGSKKAKQIMRKSSLDGFNKLKTLIESLDEDGNIIPKIRGKPKINEALEGDLKAVKSNFED